MSKDPFGLQPQGPSATRLLVAVALTTGFMMVYSHFFGQNVPQNSGSSAPVAEVVAAASVPLSVAMVNEKFDNSAAFSRDFFVDLKKQLSNQDVGVVRGGYRATVSASGGQMSSFALTGYESDVKLAEPLKNGLALFGLVARDNSMALSLNAAYEVSDLTERGLSLRHTTADQMTVVRRYSFDDKNFSIKQDIEVRNNGSISRAIALDLVMAEGGLKPQKSSFFSPSPSDFGVVCQHDGKRERIAFEDLKDKVKSFSGTINYAGFDKQYFLVATLPQGGVKTQAVSVVVSGSESDESGYGITLSLQQEAFALAAGESKTLSFLSFMGPKQLNLLAAASSGLEDNVNFGWFGVISRPMLWLLNQIYALVGNFGLAIILLTLIIKALTFPLTQKSFVSMQEMKKYQPDIKALQKKFAHDKTQLGQKQMELYKEKGINPMGGCLPMLLQIPVGIALYQMLYNSVELYQQPFWLWISNLTAPDPYYILPVVMGASLLVQTMFQPAPEDQPQMKYVMYGMPFFFTFIMLKMPAGLSLYFLVNNILTIFQQMYIKRKYATKA